ncbi:hypothetical protein FKM82_011024 [Ascaphus truei]
MSKFTKCWLIHRFINEYKIYTNICKICQSSTAFFSTFASHFSKNWYECDVDFGLICKQQQMCKFHSMSKLDKSFAHLQPLGTSPAFRYVSSL